jgi:hypothetical protein
VKSDGDFEDILAADNPDVWVSNRPAETGETGAMLKSIIERAAALRASRTPAPRGSKKRVRPPSEAKAASAQRARERSERRARGGGAPRAQGDADATPKPSRPYGQTTGLREADNITSRKKDTEAVRREDCILFSGAARGAILQTLWYQVA